MRKAAQFIALCGLLTKVVQGCVLPLELDFEDESILSRPRRDITSNCDPDDPIPPNRVNTTERLMELRKEMKTEGIQAYYIPNDDEGRRTWISGFSGSNGNAIVTMNQAVCWTDGRYFLQAAAELDCNWEMLKIRQPSYSDWLTESANLTEGSIVGVDGSLLGAETFLELQMTLNASGILLKHIRSNLIDHIWTEDKGREPKQPKELVIHPISFAGQSFGEKISELRTSLRESSAAEWMVVSEKDEIAWLFNLRGEGNHSKAEGLFYSPLFEALALVTPSEVLLWAHTEKISDKTDLEQAKIQLQLADANCTATKTCVKLGPYEHHLSELETYLAQTLPNNTKVLLSKPSTYLGGASYAIYEAVGEDNAELKDSPILDAKAVKNEAEAQGMVNAHIRDAYALCEFAAFMEDQILNEGVTNWTELSAAKILSQLRASQAHSRGDSFKTISASGAHAAVIHYAPSEKTDANINDTAIYLVDSGGQYLDGTTDVTRTFHYGQPEAEMVEMYTRVLMGHIDLARLTLPVNIRDNSLDVIPRQHIFAKGLNYRHGTGHGIGAYLKVHEGPVLVRMGNKGNALKVNMFFSDEPGYYKDGSYGIRLENILQVVKKDLEETPFGDFLGFESVTLVPYEPKLIDFNLMNREQIMWYNEYNAKVRTQVAAHFKAIGNEQVYDWIMNKTEVVELPK